MRQGACLALNTLEVVDSLLQIIILLTNLREALSGIMQNNDGQANPYIGE